MKKEYLQKVIMVLTVIGGLTVLSLAIAGVIHAVRWLTARPQQTRNISAGTADQGVISEKTVMEVLRPGGDLVTIKDAYSVQESYEKHREVFGFQVPLSSDETFLAFTCEIGIGFDLTKMDITFDSYRACITLDLPEPVIVYNEIDMDSVYVKNVHDSWLVFTEDQELMDVMGEFQNRKEQEYLADGSVFRNAKLQAQGILSEYLAKSKAIAGYDVRFV